MTIDTRVLELLERWEEQQEKGDPKTPEELCANCPELLETVKKHIAELNDLQRLVDTPCDSGGISSLGQPEKPATTVDAWQRAFRQKHRAKRANRPPKLRRDRVTGRCASM